MKRADYISWDEYFMGVAHLAALRSKDPNTQVGCCIVSEDHKILSIGYNGFPKGTLVAREERHIQLRPFQAAAAIVQDRVQLTVSRIEKRNGGVHR